MLTLAVGVLALVSLVACDENGVAPVLPTAPPAPSAIPIRVEWQHPFPQGNDLNRMWGFPDGTFYAVGDAGTVLYFDGFSWTMMDTPTRNDLHGIWASAPDDVYVAGFGGVLMHYDGTSWNPIPAPTPSDLYAVWVNAPEDLFITGMGGNVWNGTGGGWSRYAVAPGQRLRALWGYGDDEVYVSGSNASFFRFDGATWSKVVVGFNLQSSAEFKDMWGPGPGSISVMGGGGAFWTDGSTWGFMNEANGRFAYGLWGLALDTQVIVAAGLSTHLVGGVIEWYDTPTPEPLYDVWGLASDDYYAIGRSGNIAHFNGTSWQSLNEGALSDVRDLWVTADGAIAVGAGGFILRQNGSEWIEENVGAGYDLSGVWEGSGLSVAVGRYAPNGRDWRQAVLMTTGGSWTDVGVVGTGHRLFDVWGSSASDVYAVGWAGEILHYDETSWSVVARGEGDAAFLRAVGGTSPTNVLAVGRTNDLRGLVCRFDGTTWTKVVLDDVEELCGVWVQSPTSAFAVGSLGAIRRYDGSTWSTMSSPTHQKLFGVWGSSSSDVYAAGWEGTLLHYDGSKWIRLLPTTHRTLNAVSGRSASETYFAGDKGAILFFDGLTDATHRVASTYEGASTP